jgi:hypothetical protein
MMTKRFFKWIKQHLNIKAFWGALKNAVRIQVYLAIVAYCLVAMVGSSLKFECSAYEILQVLGISIPDNTPVNELFKNVNDQDVKELFYNQLSFSLI